MATFVRELVDEVEGFAIFHEAPDYPLADCAFRRLLRLPAA